MSNKFNRIKVSKEEFQLAQTNGCIYGEIILGSITAYVYVELGDEKEYIEHRNDDPNTSYKAFHNSKVYYSKTESDMNNGIYEAELPYKLVIIYC